MELWRDKEANRDGSVRGVLWVMERFSTGGRGMVGLYTTIEPGGGYVNLKVGDYMMEHSMKITGRQVKCLRPVESAIEPILIHDAWRDDPKQLTGCIAPGMGISQRLRQVRRGHGDALERTRGI